MALAFYPPWNHGSRAISRILHWIPRWVAVRLHPKASSLRQSSRTPFGACMMRAPLHSDHDITISRMLLRIAYDSQVPHVTHDPVRLPG